MVFNSYAFAAFFLIVFPLYLLAKKRAPQNVLLLVASYVFYGYWDWKFLSLIAFSTGLDYACGIGIARARLPKTRKTLLALSLIGNLGVLAVFKYYNFFADNLQIMLQAVGIEANPGAIHVILPVGISFYTFQTLSYTIDIYRGKLAPTRNLLDFALFVAFFPQLVAGPIERAKHLLPQMMRPRKLDPKQFHEGCWLVLWGLYKKVFVADNLALMVDRIYANPGSWSAPSVCTATYAFALQIYCDFSGYTDIARGIAKMMGFDICLNFNIPYAARNPSDFWRRWHISLSEWLRDYLYIPLGGNRGSRLHVLWCLTATMALGGLWHGAAWNFVLWGIFHGALLVAYRIAWPSHPTKPDATWKSGLQILLMFHLTCLGWVLFRIENLHQLSDILTRSLVNWQIESSLYHDLLALLRYGWLLILIQVLQYRTGDLLRPLKWPLWGRIALYLLIYFSITLGGVHDGQQFIYFQF